MKIGLSNLIFLLLLAPLYGQQIDLDVAEAPPCFFESESNFFENGLRSSSEGTQLVANDLIVSANDSFTLQEVAANFFLLSAVQATNMNVTFYADDNGVPGTVLETMTDEIPTSAVIVGDVFSAEIWRISLTIPDFEFAGQPGVETRYWISVSISNTTGDDWAFWETKSVGQQGFQPAVNDSGTGWNLVDISGGQHFEGVYEFIGECILGTEDISEFTWNVAPNPVENALMVSLSSPGNLQIMNAHGTILYEKVYTEGIQEISLQNMKSGIYFVQFITEIGRSTKKIIKE